MVTGRASCPCRPGGGAGGVEGDVSGHGDVSSHSIEAWAGLMHDVTGPPAKPSGG